MKIYKVGGAVRDSFMGLPAHDNDYVVVGATPAEMENLGFKQVGKDFPVYLHPETGEEYALARVERKSGLKHTDFETRFDPSVTIEQDLIRRDLTINAIAVDEDGNIIDPFGGVEDIKNKVIRHVSEAFKEDPLRILRVARFKARFPEFEIHYSTSIMIKDMVKEGALDHISKDRIWAETKKSLISTAPEKYFYQLRMFDALHYVTNMDRGSCWEADFARVCKNTEHFPEEKKVLLRAAWFYQYNWLSVLPDYKGDKKLFIKALRGAKVPVDIIELATFCGEHCDTMFNVLNFTWQTDAKTAVKLYDSMNIRAMVQKNPTFLSDMFLIMAENESDAERFRKIQHIMEAYLDTKEFLACEMKRFKWATGQEPTTEQIKDMLHEVKLKNVDAAIDRYWGGIQIAGYVDNYGWHFAGLQVVTKE
jgi:tRNA nucleotidyltransferase/poly(A) polymerase